VLACADWGSQLAGDSFFPGGPLDEIAHLMTTLLVLWMLGPRVCQCFLVPALIASVAIDLDHVPGRLGIDWLTKGTPRPYTHSLLTVAIVLAVGLVWPRRRRLLIGVAIGLVIHFLRDVGEPGSGVALLWPLSYHAFEYSHRVYVITMVVVVLVDAVICRRQGAGGDHKSHWRLDARHVRAQKGAQEPREPAIARRRDPA
jgi:inner membrane protein